MSFEDWQAQNKQIKVGGFESWQAENEVLGIDLPTGGTLQEFGKGAVDSFLQGGRAAINVAADLSPVGFGLKKLAPEIHEAIYRKPVEKIEAAREPFEMTHQGTAAQAGRILGEAVGYMGQALAGGYVAGPMGAAMVGFNIEGQQAYDSAIEGGATEQEAQTERLIVGSINAAIEALQINKVMKFGKTGKHSVKAFINAARSKAYKEMARLGKDFGSDILKHSIMEGLEELAQEGVSMTVPAVLRDDYPVTPDGSPDIWAIGERLGQAAVGGAFAGSVLGAGTSVVLADPMRPSRAKIEAVAKKINESDLSDRAKARMVGELQKLMPIEETIKKADILFHGSPLKGLTKIKPSSGDYGFGVYLGDKTTAEQYSYGRKNIAAYVLGDTEISPTKGVVYEIENPMKKPLIIKNEQQYEQLLDQHGDDNKGIGKWAKSKGYDGIINNYSNEHIVFTNKSIPIKSKSLLQIPESTRKVLDIADRVAGVLRENLQARRGEFKEYVKEGRSKSFKKQVKILNDLQAEEANPIITKQAAQGIAKGELRKDFPDIADNFTRED